MEMTDALKAVKDKPSAEAALPKLKALEEKGVAIKKTPHKYSLEDVKAVSEKYKSLKAELARLEELPEVRRMLMKESGVFQEFAATNMKTARVKIKTINFALGSYFASKNEYPKSLNVLTEGDIAILPDADSIVDPWKKPFQYDPKGPKNNGSQPDVWTVSPDKEVICNWEEMKK